MRPNDSVHGFGTKYSFMGRSSNKILTSEEQEFLKEERRRLFSYLKFYKR
jgi:hypothetical protein